MVFLAVRQRQEEKRQQEECSKVKERKRKREKYAEKVKQRNSRVTWERVSLALVIFVNMQENCELNARK